MTKKHWSGVLVGGVLVLLGAQGAVRAQESEVLTTGPEVTWQPRSGVGVAVLAGGGMGDFTDETVSQSTGMGGSWNLRVTSGTRLPFAWELAYMGGANDVTGLGLDSDDYLIRNAAEGGLRLNAPILTGGGGLVEPFAVAGLGWSRYNLVNSSPSPGRMEDQDDQLTVPLALGLAFGYRGVAAELRGSYRFAFDDEMFGDRDMSGWNASMGVGVEF
jgi:hypothetical protein